MSIKPITSKTDTSSPLPPSGGAVSLLNLPKDVQNYIFTFPTYTEVARAVRPVHSSLQDAFPNDGHLDFSDSHIDDAGLIDILNKHKGKITSLNLRGCYRLTGAALIYIAQFAKEDLISLDLSNCSCISNDTFKAIASLKKLASLNLNCNLNISNNMLKEIPALEYLNTLDLSGCLEITDDGLKHLSSLKNLATLSLRGIGGSYIITRRGLEYLKRLKNSLTSLDLFHCGFLKGENLRHLASLPHLKKLDLSYCEIKSGLKYLTALEHLISLNLTGCDFADLRDHDLLEVAKFTHLIKLKLNYCPNITGEGLKNLAPLKNLRSLGLMSNTSLNLSPQDLRELLPLENLTSLKLQSRCSGCTDDILLPLSSLPSLKKLALYFSPISITAAGLAALKWLTRLTILKESDSPRLDQVIAEANHLRSLEHQMIYAYLNAHNLLGNRNLFSYGENLHKIIADYLGYQLQAPIKKRF